MICLAILTDGRAELFSETLESARANLKGDITHRILINDSGDPSYKDWLKHEAPEFVQFHHDTRRGLAGAVQSVWKKALRTGCEYLFHLEGDWTFTQPVDIDALALLLLRKPYLAEVVLQRQALTPDEIIAGGVAAQDSWVQCVDILTDWIEQTDIFSLNPCLIPRWVLEKGWPSGPIGVGNETGMTKQLADYRFAFWGRKDDPPTVTHIGHYRTPGWSL